MGLLNLALDPVHVSLMPKSMRKQQSFGGGLPVLAGKEKSNVVI